MLYQEAPATHAGADVLLRAALAAVDASQPTVCEADLYVYTATEGEAARGQMFGCRISFDRGYRNNQWAIVTDPSTARAERVEAAADVCGAAAHERGHNRGLTHTATGLMAPVLLPSAYPAACWRWAATVVPTRKDHRTMMSTSTTNPRRRAVERANATARVARERAAARAAHERRMAAWAAIFAVPTEARA